MEAWGDESIRVVGNPPLYLLAASYASAGDRVDMAPLLSIKPKGASKLHWRDMGDRLKARSTNAIASLSVAHTVVVGCNMVSNKQERARRKCLEILLPELERVGVERYVLESRGPNRDKADIAFLLSMRAKGLCGSIDIIHEKGANDARLWIPDQVLGAYGDIRCGVASDALVKAWTGLGEAVTTIEVEL